MRPQLVVDLGDRIFSALLVTPEGEILPCSQEIYGVSTRYFSSEIVVDPRISENPDFLWDEAVELLAKATPASFFPRARRLGLRRPWDSEASADALRLASPLAVLSSPTAMIDPVVQEALPGVGVILLDALLDPIFAFLADRNIAAGVTDAFVVIPGHTGRRARLALHKVFRRRGFRRVNLLAREIAAAMALLDEAPVDCLVWDVADDDLHLHRVAVRCVGTDLELRTLAARTAPGLGWSHWVQQIGTALTSESQVHEHSGARVPELERALTNLLTGFRDTSKSSLSHDLLQATFDAEACERLSGELRKRLEPHLAELDAQGLPVIQLGALCGLESLKGLFLSAVAGAESLTVSKIPSLERTTRSVAAALLWMREDPSRRIATPPSGSLRLNTFCGEALELLPAAQLPCPGEECLLRYRLDLSGDQESTTSILIQLLWGSDAAPEGNASLSVLPLETSQTAEGPERAIWLTIHLRLSPGGRWLNGRMCADLRSEEAARSPQAREFFTVYIASATAG